MGGMPGEYRPESAAYLQPALTVLGLTPGEFFPDEVRAAYAAVQPPPDIDWVGTPVWQTAYVTGLRAIAAARHRDRMAAGMPDATAFNKRWREQYLGLKGAEEATDSPAALGSTMLRQVVRDSQQSLDRAARRVRLANTLLLSPPETVPSAVWSASTADDEQRVGLQAYAGDSLQWFTVSPPRMSEKTKLGHSPQLPDALLIVLPTASGKTKIAGDWLARLGVGRGKGSPRALWVTDQQQLVVDCTKPDKTLRRCLPEGTKVTAVWEGHKTEEDASGDVVVTTKDSAEAETIDSREGRPDKAVNLEAETRLINPDDFDIVVFDEADVMQSALKMSVVRRFDACTKLLLTATPSRNARKDLQRIVHHIRPVTLMEAVKRKIIAPVRILTFVAQSPEHAEQIAAAAALQLFIAAGKKATMYCQPGGRNAQARRIVQAVQAHIPEVLGAAYRPEGRYAEVVGDVQPDSLDIIEFFDTMMEVGLLATSSMLGRGWDPRRLDGSLFVGPQGNIVTFPQEMGRGLRREPANPDKIALIVQIKYPPRAGRVDYSAEMFFGLEEIMTGITLGAGVGYASPSSSAASASGDASRPAPGRPEPDPAWTELLEKLPDDLKTALQPLGRPLSEVLLAPDDPRYNKYVRPPGYTTSVGQLMEQFPGVPRQWFYDNLDHFHYTDPETGERRTGIPRVLICALSPDAQPPADRYYHTAGVAKFLQTVDVPKIVSAESLSAKKLAQRLNVPVTLVKLGARTLTIEAEDNTLIPGAPAKAGRRYNAAEIARISAWVEAIPVADDTKVWHADLVRQYGRFAETYFARARVSTQLLRHPPDSGLNGIGSYVDIEEADAMKTECRHITELMLTHRSLREIVRRCKVPADTVLGHVTPEEQAYLDDSALKFSGIGTAKRDARHLPIPVADKLEARVKDQRLGPVEVSRVAVAGRLGISESRLEQLGAGYRLGAKRIGPRNARSAIYHIAVLRMLAKYYLDNKSKSADTTWLWEIDFSKLPRRGENPTPEQEKYARYVQRTILGIENRLLRPPQIKPEPGPGTAAAAQEWRPIEATLARLRCTPAALAYLIVNAGAHKGGIRRDEGGAMSIRGDFAAQIEQKAAQIHSHPPEDWARHGRLAARVGVTEDRLTAFMRRHGIVIGDDEIRLARAWDGSLDVVYAHRIWRWTADAADAHS